MPLANTGAVLAMLDGPKGCDPVFQVSWVRFRMIRRFVALRPEEIRRAHTMLDRATEGCSGQGPIQLLIHSSKVIGWTWDVGLHAWSRPGLPELHM